MSEDKTQNGYEGSQELDFQDAKEMTVGEAVRKEAEINAGVTETDSILDKYIKQHREEVASQKFSKKIEADGDTSPLDAFIQKQRQEFADSGLIGQSMANESINSTTATEGLWHGLDDDVVPADESLRLQQALSETGRDKLLTCSWQPGVRHRNSFLLLKITFLTLSIN